MLPLAEGAAPAAGPPELRLDAVLGIGSTAFGRALGLAAAREPFAAAATPSPENGARRALRAVHAIDATSFL